MKVTFRCCSPRTKSRNPSSLSTRSGRQQADGALARSLWSPRSRSSSRQNTRTCTAEATATSRTHRHQRSYSSNQDKYHKTPSVSTHPAMHHSRRRKNPRQSDSQCNEVEHAKTNVVRLRHTTEVQAMPRQRQHTVFIAFRHKWLASILSSRRFDNQRRTTRRRTPPRSRSCKSGSTA